MDIDPKIDDRTIERMMELARTVRAKAYAPYSNFPVGAVALAVDGQLYPGCNVENAAYPLGNCAEASALAAMVAAGGRRLRAILVMGGDGRLCAPCGGCRQRIREFGEADTPVYIADPETVRLETTLGVLLPHAFGPENLEG